VVDEGGVALAAIQGLNEKLKDKDVEIQALEKKLDELQTMVKQLAAQK
jgi:predicted RNase H-like nuclease (RuvC/YqgF family)